MFAVGGTFGVVVTAAETYGGYVQFAWCAAAATTQPTQAYPHDIGNPFKQNFCLLDLVGGAERDTTRDASVVSLFYRWLLAAC